MFSVLVWGYNWILINALVILFNSSNSSNWTKIYIHLKKLEGFWQMTLTGLKWEVRLKLDHCTICLVVVDSFLTRMNSINRSSQHLDQSTNTLFTLLLGNVSMRNRVLDRKLELFGLSNLACKWLWLHVFFFHFLFVLLKVCKQFYWFYITKLIYYQLSQYFELCIMFCTPCRQGDVLWGPARLKWYIILPARCTKLIYKSTVTMIFSRTRILKMATIAVQHSTDLFATRLLANEKK